MPVPVAVWMVALTALARLPVKASLASTTLSPITNTDRTRATVPGANVRVVLATLRKSTPAVAVPAAVLNTTVTGVSDAADSVMLNGSGARTPAGPSAIIAPTMRSVGCASSLVMVPVATPLPARVALVGIASVAVKVSLGSRIPSPLMVMAIGRVRVPAGKVSVPERTS